MRALYVSQQGCALSLRQEAVVVKLGEMVLEEVPLPMVEQILVFGKSQVTTHLVCACLQRDVPIVYLSQMGRCYGRLIPIERGYRQLARYQQALGMEERLGVARAMVQAKIRNGRVLLMRQQRRQESAVTALAIEQLMRLSEQAGQADSLEQLMGFEGAGAASYFAALGACLSVPAFVFTKRSRRPPEDPVNAMLSFGYQILWNHLLSLVELQGLDPYDGCLHQGSERHAALVSDLIEEFRAPIVDSLVLYLVNQRMVDVEADFEYREGACFLNQSGRKQYLRAFLQRMEEQVGTEAGQQPRWDLLNGQVKAFKRFVYQPSVGYCPYLIR